VNFMAYDEITKKDVREMPWKMALDVLIDGTNCHLKGAGCGPGHQVPVGEEKQRYMIAVAKAHYKLYKYYPDYVR